MKAREKKITPRLKEILLFFSRDYDLSAIAIGAKPECLTAPLKEGWSACAIYCERNAAVLVLAELLRDETSYVQQIADATPALSEAIILSAGLDTKYNLGCWLLKSPLGDLGVVRNIFSAISFYKFLFISYHYAN